MCGWQETKSLYFQARCDITYNDTRVNDCAIDYFSTGSVATADIAGAYLNADMDDEVYVRFTGSMMEILCEICPEYKSLLVEEKGKKLL